MNQHETIELEDFDREYGLTDLFPVSMAKELLEPIEDSCRIAVIQPNGKIHYGQSCKWHGKVGDAAFNAVGYAEIAFGQGRATIFALTHELETIGYLVLEEKRTAASDLLLGLGRFMAKAINRMIHLNYKNRLTAGLHGRVVEDSYTRLKETNACLRISEEKYRKLAEDLEAEVARQTETIRSTQLIMLQQEKLAAVGHLAAGVAHEINNPIGFIVSNLNALQTYARDIGLLVGEYRAIEVPAALPPDIDQAFKNILGKLAALHQSSKEIDIDFVLEDMSGLIAESLEGAERVKTIVQNLRDFARPSIENEESADINQCLETTLALFSGQVADGVRIEKHYQPLPTVLCRQREINQVFFQVLRNALQAVGKDGRITIITRSLNGDMVEIAIADTGPGIEESVQPHIFEPFFTTRDVGSGMGLGLNLAYNLVKKHQGRITVKSNPGEGSTFTIRIPTHANTGDEHCLGGA